MPARRSKGASVMLWSTAMDAPCLSNRIPPMSKTATAVPRCCKSRANSSRSFAWSGPTAATTPNASQAPPMFASRSSAKSQTKSASSSCHAVGWLSGSSLGSGRHFPYVAPSRTHAFAQEPLELRIAVVRQIAGQVGRIELVEAFALQFSAMAARAAEHSGQPFAVCAEQSGVARRRSIEAQRSGDCVNLPFAAFMTRRQADNRQQDNRAHLPSPPEHRA